ncbi:hypothetical protein [Krasilnikoviella flava]|uniref:Uncharacterized protein n=1 Tax=Krasilnikoviella flava TaxID=526729 RepID=A0A1T5K3M2_9MICO|nr:hypothetical protein [Krasilnikoviella flava]SKC58174.1 hypothetical protein SAMN04324258_1798 [Krasilnikoviella flava]
MTETAGDDAPSRAGFVDDAIRRMRVAAAAAGRGGAPGAAGTADPEAQRTALAALPPDDQLLLWATHVQRHEPAAVAAALGTHTRAVPRLLGQAEQALAAALEAAHAHGCPPGCAATRRALGDLTHRRVQPAQETEPEDHLVACPACLHAFVDVREPAWALRDAGPRLLAGGWRPAAVLAATADRPATPAPRPVRRQSWLIVAGTVACVAVAGVAIALGSGDAAPAAPGPGSSPEATTVGTVPDGGVSPAVAPTSTTREGGPSAGPMPSGDATETPTGEPSPTPSGDDDSVDPDPSATSSPTRGDDPTSSPTSSSSGSPSTPSSPRPSSTTPPEDPPTEEEPAPTDSGTPSEDPTNEPTDGTSTEPAPTPSADPEPTGEPGPTEPTE